jgi:hypothetical protein
VLLVRAVVFLRFCLGVWLAEASFSYSSLG